MRLSLLTLPIAALLATPARADDDWLVSPGAATSRAVRGPLAHARRGAADPRAPESQLPRQGAYARAVALDASGHHVEALREYGAALAELAGLATRLSVSSSRERVLHERIVWQRELSEQLLEQDAYAAVLPTSLSAHFNLAEAVHGKFLAVRAFLGRGPRPLWLRARDEYLAALALDGRHAGARLGLARLYADAGLLEEARREHALLGRRRDADFLAMDLAAYHAAVGDGERALEYLRRAMAQPENRRRARLAPEFDALRDDPRFAGVVADPEPAAGEAR